ncbi:class I SAM-dependent methyltransferase [Amphritea sp. 1_MG-2023]|uniref:class I SAM-dependent methyltransferase n=1 Tax=Amphritea sp. 1_MG-2023 TaxID=3062670 RepID=UPI0026E19DB9|nr:class I SAM-dependent methyltransferase [Amphritea sp. 1_MG-2023]MDO6565354.1 class I SAM-dependent methyltransferase [Amphritea sp. 1_MG-2023]
MSANIGVCYVDEAGHEDAQALAQRLNLPLLDHYDLRDEQYSQLLICEAGSRRLQQTGRKAPGPVLADFVSGAVAHRRKFGGGKGQMIAKAVGIKGSIRPQVTDVTAGLGRDSFVLATLGCEVQMVERSPIIHALLESGLQQALCDPEVADIAARMQLVNADSIDWLAEQLTANHRPQVIYVDPMFPHTEKSALVKKEMRAFRDIVGDDQDSAALLERALNLAEYRVVVKRPRKAPAIEGQTPSYQLNGKSSRYDIYTLKSLS